MFSTSIKASRHPSRQCRKEKTTQTLPSLPTVSSSSSSNSSNNDNEKTKKKKDKNSNNNKSSSSSSIVSSDDSGEKGRMDGKAVNDIQSNISSSNNSSSGIFGKNMQIYPKKIEQVKIVLFDGKANQHEIKFENYSIV